MVIFLVEMSITFTSDKSLFLLKAHITSFSVMIPFKVPFSSMIKEPTRFLTIKSTAAKSDVSGFTEMKFLAMTSPALIPVCMLDFMVRGWFLRFYI